ncbi:heme peroxidase [Chytridium lagenaria]|nr:heme peroxidase [Chytridium lagenaria]
MTTRHYERGQGSHVPTSHVAVSTSLVLLLVLIGFSSAQTNVTEVQSYNGYGNNRMNPTWGAVGTPYIRMVPPTYGPNQSPGGSTRPNARLISNQLFSKSPFLYSNKNVTDFLPNWGLLLHMDVMVTERNQSDPFHIPVTSPDPFFNPAGLSNISISMNRSVHIAVDATRNLRVHVNSVSSFIDGSSLYGLTNETAMSMRSFRDGLLKSQNFSTGEFPVKTTGGMFLFPLMDANRTPQILAIHIVLLREHQRRAREIKAVYPNWSDEQIYQRARRWVIAIIQKITYEQYLPVVLGEPLARYTAYNDTINPQADIFFTNVAMRYGHSAIAQLVMRYEENGQVSDVGHQLIRNCIFGSNPWDVQTHGVESLLRGMAIQKEQLVDVSVVDDMRDHFVVRGLN